MQARIVPSRSQTRTLESPNDRSLVVDIHRGVEGSPDTVQKSVTDEVVDIVARPNILLSQVDNLGIGELTCDSGGQFREATTRRIDNFAGH